jgi:putative aldouronate transport system substrate-binding protein
MTNHNVGWDDLDYITALIGEDGTCTYMETTNFNFVTAIPKSSPNAADVVNWWNLRIQDDLHITIGDEGVHFNYDANGGIDPINPIFADERGSSYYYCDVTTFAWGTELWPSRVRKSAGQWHAFERVTMNAPDYIEFTTNEFKFKPATENYSTYNVTLFNDTMDFLKQVMAGTRTSADIEAIHNDLVVAGLDDVRVELQEYYDAK